MLFFDRERKLLRAILQFGHARECAVNVRWPAGVNPREQYWLFQTFYVALMARLLYDAGRGRTAEEMLLANRALFNDLLDKQPVTRFAPGECLGVYRQLCLVENVPAAGEQHTVILKQKRNKSVICDVRSHCPAVEMLRKHGPWSLIRYGEQRFGRRVYQDLSDALHRMDRFYRDMPYWQREGLLTVPRLTMGIMSK